MRIESNQMFPFTNNPGYRAITGSGQANGRNARRDNIMQMRLQARKREQQIRKQEEKQINMLQERMRKIQTSDDKDFASKQALLSVLEDRIKEILHGRAEREVLAVEQEMLWTQMLLEDSAEPEDKRPKQTTVPKEPEEMEKARQRDAIVGLTRIAASQERLTTLKQTRAALISEAGHIRRAIESENSNYVKIGAGEGLTVSVQMGYGDPADFRNRHLTKLNEGIARTSAAITHAISSMYHQSAKLQESQLNQLRRPDETEPGEAEPNKPEPENADANHNDTGMDAAV